MITEEQIREKLQRRPGRGGVRLSYAEAQRVLELLDAPKFDRETIKVLIDQRTRELAQGQGKMMRVKAPVIDVPLKAAA